MDSHVRDERSPQSFVINPYFPSKLPVGMYNFQNDIQRQFSRTQAFGEVESKFDSIESFEYHMKFVKDQLQSWSNRDILSFGSSSRFAIYLIVVEMGIMPNEFKWQGFLGKTMLTIGERCTSRRQPNSHCLKTHAFLTHFYKCGKMKTFLPFPNEIEIVEAAMALAYVEGTKYFLFGIDSVTDINNIKLENCSDEDIEKELNARHKKFAPLFENPKRGLM